MSWKRLLANVTGSIDEELRVRNEYLVTENRILRSKIEDRRSKVSSDSKMRNDESLPQSAGSSGEERWRPLRRSSSLIPFSVGMHDWWLASSMAPATTELRDDHRYARRLKLRY